MICYDTRINSLWLVTQSIKVLVHIRGAAASAHNMFSKETVVSLSGIARTPNLSLKSHAGYSLIIEIGDHHSIEPVFDATVIVGVPWFKPATAQHN